MSILELLIYILSIGLIGIIISKKSLKNNYILGLLTLLIVVLMMNVILDGLRWQVYLLYLSAIILVVLVYLLLIMNLTFPQKLRSVSIIVLSVFIGFSIIFSIVFPVYAMPKVDGDYLIGTDSFVIQTDDRLELYTDDQTDLRRFKIQIWYPAETTDGYDVDPWFEDGKTVTRALSKYMGLPGFVLDHTAKIESNSYIEAPISDALTEYPVVVISHGWTGFRNLHNDFAEELASHGYIVVGIDHTYGSVATVFNEDDVAYLNEDALPPMETTPDFETYSNQLVNTYAGDVIDTLDYLEVINANGSTSQFSGKIDLDNIGLLGHSTGGGGDVTVALNDDRITSVMGLDAWVQPIDQTDISKGLDIPSLFLRSGQWEDGDNNDNLYAVIKNSSYPSLLYQIDGTTHYDFTMVYMYSPLTRTIGFTGSIKGTYLNSILETMVVDFFNETLKHDTTVEVNADAWEEVRNIEVE